MIKENSLDADIASGIKEQLQAAYATGNEEGRKHVAALQAEISVLEDRVAWVDLGLAEWRDMAMSNARQAKAARATARVAIGHLQGVLGIARTHAEQQAADTAARDWLESIGSDAEGER
jgi:hypothetical protein